MASPKTIKHLILSAIVICSGYSLPSFAHDRYQEWRSTPVYREQIRTYDYVYYPEQQTYFSPSTNNWFWLSGNGWQISTRLPERYNIDLRFGGIPVSLHSERPYFEHAFVERNYGRPWRDSYVTRSYVAAPRYNQWRYEQPREQRYERNINRDYDRDEWRRGEHNNGHHGHRGHHGDRDDD